MSHGITLAPIGMHADNQDIERYLELLRHGRLGTAQEEYLALRNALCGPRK